MPTILNNSCVNRVAKVKKVKLSSNDLTAIKVTPYNLLTLKDGQVSRVPFLCVVFTPDTCDYIGDLILRGPYYYPLMFTSWVDSAASGLFTMYENASTNDSFLLTVSESFEVGVNRPDIELHLYYFEESVSVNFDVDYIPS